MCSIKECLNTTYVYTGSYINGDSKNEFFKAVLIIYGVKYYSHIRI